MGDKSPESVCLSVCGRNSKLVNSHNLNTIVYACHMWKSEGGLYVNVKLHFYYKTSYFSVPDSFTYHNCLQLFQFNLNFVLRFHYLLDRGRENAWKGVYIKKIDKKEGIYWIMSYWGLCNGYL